MEENQPQEKPFTPKERAFIQALFRFNFNQSKAFRSIVGKEITDSYAGHMGSKMMTRIKARQIQWEVILDLAGLDDFRLAAEIGKRLRAKKTEFYMGRPIATTTDNVTRMRATELLAEVLGKKKAEVSLQLPPGLTMTLEGNPEDLDEGAENPAPPSKA